MKKILTALILCFAGGLAFAQSNNANFSVAFETSSYTYREPGPDVKVSGPKYGVSAEYLGRNARTGGLFIAAQFLYMTGDVSYDGFLMDAAHTPHSASGISDYYFESRVLFGFAAADSANPAAFWPYLGIGYRHLFNGMGADAYGYDRTSTYVYLPAGLRARFKMANGWAFTPTGELDIFLNGTQQSALPGEMITNRQQSGFGLRASARLSKNFGRFGLFVEPFVRYWNIEESDAVYSYYFSMVYHEPRYAYEPANHTQEYGLKIGVNF